MISYLLRFNDSVGYVHRVSRILKINVEHDNRIIVISLYSYLINLKHVYTYNFVNLTSH